MADKEKACGCKGIRSCLLCEKEVKKQEDANKSVEVYHFCMACKSAWKSVNHVMHTSNADAFDFPGIYLQEEFISDEDELMLCKEIDKTPYSNSQSGRRKQDYGPKVNFKKQKVKCDVFTGLPSYSEKLYYQMLSVPVMADFIPVEMCNLEYVPERGSSIDPHFDDFWLWGERLVTVNLLSSTILCFTCDEFPNVEVHVPLNRKSLVVVYGPARHKWKHGIHRRHICGRRIAMTFRELSANFEEYGKDSSVGKILKDVALRFNGFAVGIKPES